MLRFAEPLAFVLLLGVALWLILRRKRSRPSVLYTEATLLRAAAQAGRGWLHPGLLTVLRTLVLVLAIVALARPQLGSSVTEIETKGVDILVALDLSTSMWAHDFELSGVQVDRLTAVKSVLEDFIEARPNDRIGLVAFAALPYLVSPLTLDHDWLGENLDRLTIGRIEDGTAIGSAIGMSANRLRQLEAESRILILMTDGENNSGEIEPIDAAEAAAALDIRIYAIGVGTVGIVNVPRRDPNGVPYRDRNGRMVFRQQRSNPDFSALEEVAEATGGRAFRADNQNSLEEIYATIDELERTERELQVRAQYEDWWIWPLFGGLFFFFLEILLAHTWLRVQPANA